MLKIAVKTSEAKAAQPKQASQPHPESFDLESENDSDVITREGFDNFCDMHLGVAAHKAWRLKIIGRLKAAYESDNITS